MKGLGGEQSLLVARAQAPRLRVPRMSPFNDPPGFPQATAVGLTRRGQLGPDLALPTLPTVGGRAVGAVALQACRPLARSPARAANRRDRIEQRDRLGGISDVGGGKVQGQGRALAIGEDVTFYAPFGAIRGVGSRVGPPKTARLEALSMRARDQSIWSASPSSSRR